MHIEKHIAELLFEHDCVIVPHFGGFVGNYKPSKLDAIQNKFSPPSKEISFNKNLIHNDGLLANRIVQKENKSYDEANSLLKKISDEWKHTLKQRNKIELPQIGILFSDNEQNILFEPNYSGNLLIDSFGLLPLHSPPLKKPLPVKEPSLREKTVPLTFNDRVPELQQKKFTERKIGRYALYAASALPLLLLLLWAPFNIEKIRTMGQKVTTMNYSNLISFSEKPNAIYRARQENEEERKKKKEGKKKEEGDGDDGQTLKNIPDTVAMVAISLLDETHKITVRLQPEMNRQQAPEKGAKRKRQKSSGRNRFHIIGGCFEFLENAQKLVGRMQQKGFRSAIIDKHKGLYRVSIQSCRSRKEANEKLAQIKNNGDASVWLLVK